PLSLDLLLFVIITPRPTTSTLPYTTLFRSLDFNAVAHSAAKADGIEVQEEVAQASGPSGRGACPYTVRDRVLRYAAQHDRAGRRDRKSTRLNSSHLVISYAVFCLKKKKEHR